jgi:Protein of unknown function (DUF1326)
MAALGTFLPGIISGHMWIFISLLTGCSLNLSELSKLKLLCCSGQRRTGWAMAIEWRLTGSYFETCNCEAACPCNFLGPPTDGHCTVLVGWRIDQGEFEGTGLGGLNVALVVHAPGHMLNTKWKVALYLDDRLPRTSVTS